MVNTLPRWFRPRAERAFAAMLELSFEQRGVEATRRAIERQGEVWRAAVGVDREARGCALGLARKAWRSLSEAPPPLKVSPAFSFDPVHVDSVTAALLRAAATERALAKGAPRNLVVRTRFSIGVLGLVALGELTDARVARLAFGSLDGLPSGVHLAIYDAALSALESQETSAVWVRMLNRARTGEGPSTRAAHRLLTKDQRFTREYLTCRRDGPVSMRVSQLPPPPKRARPAQRRAEDLFAP